MGGAQSRQAHLVVVVDDSKPDGTVADNDLIRANSVRIRGFSNLERFADFIYPGGSVYGVRAGSSARHV